MGKCKRQQCQQNAAHDPSQPEAGAVCFGKRQEDAFFLCPEAAQCIPSRAEAVQQRVPREQDNEKQCRQQNGEQQLRLLEMPDDCGCNASQNTRTQQPEHCSKTAYRVANHDKREENQEGRQQFQQRLTARGLRLAVDSGSQAGQILLFHIGPPYSSSSESCAA